MVDTYTPTREPINRYITLSGSIDNSTVSTVSEFIHEINKIDCVNEEEFKDYERLPIRLFINTFGGSVYDGLGLYDTIELSETKVYTIANGSAMSMGFIILLAGHRRFATKNSTLLYHEISNCMCDKLSGFKLEVKEMERLQNIMDDIVQNKTKITKKTLSEIKDKKNDWYIDSKTALKLKIIHEIYNNQI
jgi:ATP-dependent Clp protease protease subunit